jgi:hypothetical protein
MFIEKEYLEKWFEKIMARFDRLEKKYEKPENPRQTIDGEVVLDNQDLCMMLNVCKRTLQRYRSLGWLPYRKIDQKTYYMESDVKIFIDEYMRKLRNVKNKK